MYKRYCPIFSRKQFDEREVAHTVMKWYLQASGIATWELTLYRFVPPLSHIVFPATFWHDATQKTSKKSLFPPCEDIYLFEAIYLAHEIDSHTFNQFEYYMEKHHAEIHWNTEPFHVDNKPLHIRAAHKKSYGQ